MNNHSKLKQELQSLELKEKRFLNKKVVDGKLKEKVYEKIPENLEETLNNVFTTSVGTGMGILGLGIPDIPLFVATILRGIYQISLSYGFDYKTKKEKVYILRLIRTALAKTPEEKYKHNENLENGKYYNIILEDEIKYTAQVMANSLLLEKFIQGIPVVGAVGGAVNNSIYKKISNFSMIKYKKRYIKEKI